MAPVVGELEAAPAVDAEAAQLVAAAVAVFVVAAPAAELEADAQAAALRVWPQTDSQAVGCDSAARLALASVSPRVLPPVGYDSAVVELAQERALAARRAVRRATGCDSAEHFAEPRPVDGRR